MGNAPSQHSVCSLPSHWRNGTGEDWEGCTMTHRLRPTLPPPAAIILRDGTTAWLRPAQLDDADRLGVLFGRASGESLWLRFFTAAKRLDRRDLERMVDIDGTARM